MFTAKRLGKLRPRFSANTPRLHHYLTGPLPAPPRAVEPPIMPNWGVMLNDAIGDCTIAAAGHLIELWTQSQGNLKVVTDAQVIAGYEAVTGSEGAAYDPRTGANDNGCAILDVLNYWRGIGIGGHKIDAYAMVQPSSIYHLKQAISLFGAIDVGLNLPIAAQGQLGNLWHCQPGGGANGDYTPGRWGGHSVPIIGYTDTFAWCVTWGRLQKMTWNWLQMYCDEAYAVLSSEWLNSAGVAKSGFNLAQLRADLKAI